MITCECTEGQCLHRGSYLCECISKRIDFHPLQQCEPSTTQIIEQQQLQKQPNKKSNHQDSLGETFGGEEYDFLP